LCGGRASWVFTLEDVQALLALSADQGKDTCAEVRQLAAGI